MKMPLEARLVKYLNECYPTCKSRRDIITHFVAQGDEHSGVTGRLAEATHKGLIRVVGMEGNQRLYQGIVREHSDA